MWVDESDSRTQTFHHSTIQVFPRLGSFGVDEREDVRDDRATTCEEFYEVEEVGGVVINLFLSFRRSRYTCPRRPVDQLCLRTPCSLPGKKSLLSRLPSLRATMQVSSSYIRIQVYIHTVPNASLELEDLTRLVSESGESSSDRSLLSSFETQRKRERSATDRVELQREEMEREERRKVGREERKRGRERKNEPSLAPEIAAT